MFLHLRRLFNSVIAPSSPRQKAGRLRLESLDERIVPAICTFQNVNGGLVSDASNWANNQRPVQGDSIVIPATIQGTVVFDNNVNTQFVYGGLQLGATNQTATIKVRLSRDEMFLHFPGSHNN